MQVTEKMQKEIEELRLKESTAVEEQKKLARMVRYGVMMTMMMTMTMIMMTITMTMMMTMKMKMTMRTITMMRMAITGWSHFAVEAIPHSILLHFPIILSHFPIDFDSFPHN